MTTRMIGAVLLGLLWLVVGIAPAQAGTKHYYYTDAQGTVLAKADAQGNIIASYDYAPYGAQVLGTPPSGPAGYTGHVNDVESGLVYMQARYYDPAVGRFLSVDPVRPAAASVFNFNRYGYANNNPVANIDPNGEATIYVQKNGDIHIVQNFTNKGTSFSNDQIAASALLLVGKTSSNHFVSVTLTPAGAADTDVVTIGLDNSLSDTDKNENNNSHADEIGGKQITLAPDANTTTVGHEFGHVFGAGDQREGGVDASGKKIITFNGETNNLMGNGNGPVNQKSLDEIYSRYNNPDNTVIRCGSSGGYCTQ